MFSVIYCDKMCDDSDPGGLRFSSKSCVYRTWPAGSSYRTSPRKEEQESEDNAGVPSGYVVGSCDDSTVPSVNTMEQQYSWHKHRRNSYDNHQREKNGGQPEHMSLSEAMERFSLSYSPRSKRLHMNISSTGANLNERPDDEEELNKFTLTSEVIDPVKLDQVISDQDQVIVSPAKPEPSGGCDEEHLPIKSKLDISYNAREDKLEHLSRPEGDILPCTKPEPSIGPPSEPPIGPPVEPPIGPPVEPDTNESKTYEMPRYVQCHRKAFSLPRTLEVVNEDGSISHYPHPEVESPRSTLYRYGKTQVPIQFGQDDWSSISSLSSRTGVSQFEQNSETSSQGDSGIQSQAESSSSSSKQPRKGLTELISKGISANWKLFSKSGQQVVKRIRRPECRGAEESLSLETSVVSSQSLIMEDRPPGLPAKLSQEKEKHSQEFLHLLDSIRRKEKDEKTAKARRQADQRRQEDDLSASVNLWSTQIIPNWGAALQSRRTQQLWWRGLPPPVRGKVWKLALENQLNLTPQLYSILVNRAQSLIQRWSGGGEGRTCTPPTPCREETLQLIALDVSRTFPQLCIFQRGGPYYTHLHNILGAYVCYRPDLGYVQGMSFIAAILILNMEEEDAFILFANLVNRPPLAAFFNMDQPMMEGYYSTFSSLLASHLPEVSDHFESLGLRPDLYLLDWIMTLYGRAAPLDLACRIWDLMFRDGQDFIFKAGLGILCYFQDRVLGLHDFTEVAQFLAKLPERVDADALFAKIEEMHLQPRQKTFHSMFSKQQTK